MKSQVREVMKATDDNHMTLEWYENQGGGEKKTMEINYTRAGKSDGYNCGSGYRIAESCSGSRVCRKQSDARFATSYFFLPSLLYKTPRVTDNCR